MFKETWPQVMLGASL